MTEIVKKGTEEFAEARDWYLKLLFEDKEEDMIRKGIFQYGEYKGKCLGFTSKKILNANLPMPFGCPDLFVQPCSKDGKLTGVIWFCDRVGCICVCCREDFIGEKEKYPDYCPPVGGFEPEYCDCGSSTCDICNPGWDQEPEEWEEDYW